MEKVMESKFVVRDLKVYGTDEWMADGTKRYRSVFDRYELSYIHVEFSFFNKLFDEEDWDLNITLNCYTKTSNPIQICNRQQSLKVSKTENIVYIRENWGKPLPGDFWMRGDYRWEATIDNVKVSETIFHVEDMGPNALTNNEYIDIVSVKLYAGGDNPNEKERKYFLKFKQDEARYISAEVQLKTMHNDGFYSEVFFHFFDKSGFLKGKTSELIYIAPNSQNLIYTIQSGWGSSLPGSWEKNSYRVDIISMETLLASVEFEVADTWEQDTENKPLDFQVKRAPVATAQSNTKTQTQEDILQQSLSELNAMIGLSNIKTDVNEMVTLVKFYQETGKDFLNKFSLHSVFTGNPGTGKTTVARILSGIYKGLGILEKGHLVEVDRETLVAGFIGQTAIKTKAKLDEALGGILFVDEAYSLAGHGLSENDFGQEAIATILKYMEDNRGKIGIIVAGYPDNMQDFINSNPGLRSRFDKYFQFPDYSPEEMWAIASALFNTENASPNEAASAHLVNYLKWLYDQRDENFGNARTVRQVVAECVKNQNLRLAVIAKENRTAEMMNTIILDDVKEFDINEPNRWGGGKKRSKIGFRKQDD